ncbi:MAG: hypothetical protein SF187_02350 [Deltaproteobacteria bacterium]|nr:hypothetical protein [Deltaproteobacteria bacterium]
MATEDVRFLKTSRGLRFYLYTKDGAAGYIAPACRNGPDAALEYSVAIAPASSVDDAEVGAYLALIRALLIVQPRED